MLVVCPCFHALSIEPIIVVTFAYSINLLKFFPEYLRFCQMWSHSCSPCSPTYARSLLFHGLEHMPTPRCKGVYRPHHENSCGGKCPRFFTTPDTAYADSEASNAILGSSGIFFLNSEWPTLFVGNLNPSLFRYQVTYRFYRFPSLPDLFQQRNCPWDHYS